MERETRDKGVLKVRPNNMTFILVYPFYFGGGGYRAQVNDDNESHNIHGDQLYFLIILNL